MKLFDNLVSAVFSERIEKIASEAVKEAQLKAASVGMDEPGFRRLNGGQRRELEYVTQDWMLEVCYWLATQNPMGEWVVNVVRDFVTAEGLPYEATNPEVKKVLDRFWRDPINNLECRADDLIRELGIYGEQCWPVNVAEQTGRVRLGYLDPKLIQEVVTDPENVAMAIGVIRKAVDGRPSKRLKTVLDPEAEAFLSDDAKAWRESCEQECFFWKVNTVTNNPRGVSDLFIIADWLDGYEKFLFDAMQRFPQLNAFVWDVTITGADGDALREWQRDNPIPKPGAQRVHNEKVKYNAVAPDLKAADAATAARLFRNHVLSARSLPEHWYGGGGDVNRSTAAEMGVPAFRMIGRRQRLVAYMWSQVGAYVIRMAREAAYINVTDEEALDWKVNTPEIEKGDLSGFASALQSLTNSLAAATTNGWIDGETAAKVYASALVWVGYALDPDKASEAARKADENKGYNEYGGDGAKG